MSDNVNYQPPGGGAPVPIAGDNIGGVLWQRVKLTFGADGVATDVSASDPLPVVVAGVATEATLAALNGKVPPAGQALMASSQPVTIASDQSPVPILEAATILTGAAAQTAVVNNILEGAAGATGTTVENLRTGSVQVVSTGTGGTFIFEQSNNNVNWIALPVYNAALTTGVPITAAITATASAIVYIFPIRCRFLRLRIATTITGGAIQAFSRLATDPYAPAVMTVAQPTAGSMQTTVNGQVSVTGAVAEDTAVSGSPVTVGAQAHDTLPPATIVNNDVIRLRSSRSGQMTVKPFAPGDLDFNVNATVTTNAQTAIRAAQAANIRQNITSIIFQNTNATATTLTIQDGAATTLVTFSVPASMTLPVQLRFPTPLRGTAATALNYTAGTTGANVLLNVTGFNSY